MYVPSILNLPPTSQPSRLSQSTGCQVIFLMEGSRSDNWYVQIIYLFLSFFWMCSKSKSLLDLLQYYSCFMFWFLGREARGILLIAPWPGFKFTTPALEHRISTSGPPRKSLSRLFKYLSILFEFYFIQLFINSKWNSILFRIIHVIWKPHRINFYMVAVQIFALSHQIIILYFL